jgi:hypothetical protein
MKLKGRWTQTLYGPDNEIKDQRAGDNVITESGTSFVAQFLVSAAAAASTFTMNYIAIGTDSTAEASSNTALGTELDRATATISFVSGSIYRMTATFACGSTSAGAIAEYGVFDSTTGGTMLSRDVESVINKGVNDDLVTVTEITIS